MHELAITEGIISAAVPEAQKHGASRILEIRLKIGELSGVLPAYIQECFDVVSEGTIAQGARLVIERIPVTVRCAGCGFEGPIDRKKIRCPQCDGVELKIISGREYYVDSLEVE